jgi:hypothetical protein
MKKLCTSKETITSFKRQLTEREKIFGRYSVDKGLISEMYIEFQN